MLAVTKEHVSKIYPVDATEAELRQRAAELSARVLAYSSRGGNAEDLIKDSVLFNITYIELQNRASEKATRQMVWLSWISAFVALASFVVAALAYQSTMAADEWQAEQLKAFKSIAAGIKPAVAAASASAPAQLRSAASAGR